MKKKPGVMVYFDLRRMVKLLSDAEKGKLFEAILDYGETGTVGELTDTLRIVWPLIQNRLDSDSLQYDKKVVKRKYASYTRWTKEHHEITLSYEDWLETQGYDLEVYSPPLS
jgi:hypothetical protein